MEIEDIAQSIELSVGTRFYFWDRIYEVAELKDGKCGCSQCAFDKRNEEEMCEIMICNVRRYDKKCVFFKEVEESKEEE